MPRPGMPGPSSARIVRQAESEEYAAKANRIVIHHKLGYIVAMLEIVSPGNKASQHAFRAFVEQAQELLEHRIHLLILDLFPPGRRDPNGVHAAIYRDIAARVRDQLKGAGRVAPKIVIEA